MNENMTMPPESAVSSADLVPREEERPLPIGSEQLKKFMDVLRKYKAGKKTTESRIIASEQWWKLRNTAEEQKTTKIGADGGFTSKSGWLHNVIVSKHADAVEAYPEPNILPRELNDRAEARKLSAIVPCVLEQNYFEKTYNDVMWQKCKSGTGVYRVIWDKNKLGGLGDISVERANLLNLYWEPGVTDIQKSRYFFNTELYDSDTLLSMYPDRLKEKPGGKSFISSEFLYDENTDKENKATVIEVYYHKYINGKNTLQYVKFVDDIVLYATENDTEPIVDEAGNIIALPLAQTGLYDHGRYPYEFDPLFPIEGSPCGYGYVDVCMNPQTEIDLMKTSFVKNVMVGSLPRYFKKRGSGVNTDEFLDLSKAVIEIEGQLDEAHLRRIETEGLDGSALSMLNMTIQEMRETSGNTETSTGNTSSGVTAASAIAALQEASGKGSRDATKGSYRAYSRVVELCIELIRQFYDAPRTFRITGEQGEPEFVSYSNKRIKMSHQGLDFGQDMGYRLPTFDITVSAQKKNAYSKVTQNELSLQFFKMGFFDPRMADQALICLDLMEFDGKDTVISKVAKNATLFGKLIQYMQMCFAFAQKADPQLAKQIEADIMATAQGGATVSAPAGAVFGGGDLLTKESAGVKNARERSAQASQPR